MRRIGDVLVLSLAGACTQPLDGASCPCAAGYVCCRSLNVCLLPDAVCRTDAASGDGGSESGTSGGPAAGGSTGGVGDAPAGGGDGEIGGANEGGRSEVGGAAVTGGADAGSAVSAGAGGAGAAGGRGDGPGDGGEPGGGGAAGDAHAAPAFVLVATQRNDTLRTGLNLNETALDTSNVRLGTFGELARRPLRGATFAQPLVAPDVAVGEGLRRDVLIVATMANVVYALDARDPERPPIWTRELGPPVELPTSEGDLDYLGIWHEIGILGTPVLSPEENAVYAVAATRTNDVYAHTAYKLDLATGAVLKSAPVESDGFVLAIEAQRAALTLTGGVLYVPFGPYARDSGGSGWVFAFDRDLVPLGSVNLGAPSGAGVTMTGDGPAVGAKGSLFFTTGPGAVGGDTTTGYGVRVIELDGTTAPRLVERLLPEAAQSGSDELASSGPLLLPGSERLLVAGQHRLYVVDTQAQPSSSPLQALRVSGATNCVDVIFACNAEPSSPVFWPGSEATPAPRVFVWSPNDLLRSFGLSSDRASLSCGGGGDDVCPGVAAAKPADAYGAQNKLLPESARLSVSSNGAESGSGIVWALQPFVSAEQHSPEGILRAFDAERLGLLWSSELAKEHLGPIARGALPTVSGGRVFVGTADGLSHKSIFWESPTDGPPALANYDDEFLVLAWPFATPENQGFQLAWSSDGVNFDSESTLYTRFLVYQPALAADGRRLYMAWTTDEQGVSVVASDDPSFVAPVSILDSEDDSPFDGLASSAPALAYGGGRLFLAAHTDYGLELVSSDDGATFDPESHLILAGYTSHSAPLLTYEDGNLYLATSDYYSRVDLFVSNDNGAHFEEPTRLPMLAAGHPALLSFDDPEPVQVLVWTNAVELGGIQGPIMAASRFGAAGEFGRVHVFRREGAERAISSARFRGNAYIAWMGIGGAPQPNVARYTPGGLVTYGLRDP